MASCWRGSGRTSDNTFRVMFSGFTSHLHVSSVALGEAGWGGGNCADNIGDGWLPSDSPRSVAALQQRATRGAGHASLDIRYCESFTRNTPAELAICFVLWQSAVLGRRQQQDCYRNKWDDTIHPLAYSPAIIGLCWSGSLTCDFWPLTSKTSYIVNIMR